MSSDRSATSYVVAPVLEKLAWQVAPLLPPQKRCWTTWIEWNSLVVTELVLKIHLFVIIKNTHWDHIAAKVTAYTWAPYSADRAYDLRYMQPSHIVFHKKRRRDEVGLPQAQFKTISILECWFYFLLFCHDFHECHFVLKFVKHRKLLRKFAFLDFTVRVQKRTFSSSNSSLASFSRISCRLMHSCSKKFTGLIETWFGIYLQNWKHAQNVNSEVK